MIHTHIIFYLISFSHIFLYFFLCISCYITNHITHFFSYLHIYLKWKWKWDIARSSFPLNHLIRKEISKFIFDVFIPQSDKKLHMIIFHIFFLLMWRGSFSILQHVDWWKQIKQWYQLVSCLKCPKDERTRHFILLHIRPTTFVYQFLSNIADFSSFYNYL